MNQFEQIKQSLTQDVCFRNLQQNKSDNLTKETK